MPTILLATMTGDAQATSTAPVAAELARRGHDVHWYTGGRHRALVEAAGATFHGHDRAAEIDLDRLDERFPEYAGLSGVGQARWMVEKTLVDPIGDVYADLRALHGQLHVDVLLADTLTSGAALLHELDGVLWASLSLFPMALPSRDVAPFGPGWQPGGGGLTKLRNRLAGTVSGVLVFDGPMRRLNAVRATYGLPPQDWSSRPPVTPYLYLQASTPAFEYPRTDLPAHVHFVGPLLPEPGPQAPPAWWDRLSGSDPAVLVWQGRVPRGGTDIAGPAVAGLAAAGLTTLVRTGVPPAPGALDASAVDPHLLLSRADVVVCPGDFQTVQFALRYGRPVVAVARADGDAETCARLVWSGTGVDLPAKPPAADRIAPAVRTVLTGAYRDRAERVGASYRGCDGPAEVATLLERLVATRSPVPAPAE